MTDQELRDLVASLSVSCDKTRSILEKEMKEVARRQKETDRMQKETSLEIKEVARLQKETGLQMKRTDEKINKLGGLGTNIGESTEIFFYHGFKETPSLNGVAFDEAVHNIRVRRGQYDIVLYSRECVAVIEVKHKFHPRDAQLFVDEKLPKFKELFPEYKDHKLYGAIAGFIVPQDAIDIAVKGGLFVFCQSGSNMKSLNEASFIPNIY
ncbi:MAG: hypothetical protein B6244_05215 [Candidatus Cloacimonetes bacterium 4572_55]|nr:MAG: hypothetical protein B6244_05215 [Candidatus Cloacimonetes bacterium 4572_55]